MMLIEFILMCSCPILFIVFVSTTITLIFRLTRKKHKKGICKECKKEINGTHKVCPHCGIEIKRNSFKTINIILALISLFSIFGIFIVINLFLS